MSNKTTTATIQIARVTFSPMTGETLHIMATGKTLEAAKEVFYKLIMARPHSMEMAMKAQRTGKLRITSVLHNCRELVDISPTLLA
tara:strand:- start:777 stop:1034 length:258 start_codon:yes stop_codon:yes gene_type:complete